MTAVRARVPVVSVIMSVYNDASFLPEAIESILSQSFQDFEFIIINDGSTDASQQIIESYDDGRLVTHAQEHQGLTKSLNGALQIARGLYIARQDADDVSLPERLAKQVEFLDSHQDVVLVGTGITLIDEHGRRLRDYVYPSEHSTLCRWLYEFTNPFPHSSIMFQRDVVQKLGGYNELFPKAQDIDLIMRLAEHHRVASIPEALVKLRCRTDSVSVEDDQGEQWKYAVLARALTAIRQHTSVELLDSPAWSVFSQHYEEWFESSGAKRRFVSSKLRRTAILKWYQRDYLGGLRLLFQSLLCDPQWPLRWPTRRNPVWDRNTEEQVLEIARACIGIDYLKENKVD